MSRSIVKDVYKEARLVIETVNRKQRDMRELLLINGLCCKSRYICIFMDFSRLKNELGQEIRRNIPEKKFAPLNLDQISFIPLPFTA